MSYRIGTSYFGAPDIMTSTANMDIIALHKKPNWTVFSTYKFTFIPYTDCHVIINDTPPIWLQAHSPFSIDHRDKPIYSFIIIEEGVAFTYLGAF